MLNESIIIKGNVTTLVGMAPLVAAIDASPTPTVRIQTPSEGLPAESDAIGATPETLTSATVSAAERGASVLVFDVDPVFTAGRLYGIKTEGLTFTVRVLSSGTTTRLERPLPMDVAAGASVFPLALTAPLTAAQAASTGLEGLAIWTATIDGTEVSWNQHFIVSDTFTPCPVTEADVLKYWPQARKRTSTADRGLSGLLQNAWDLHVVPELDSRGARVDLFNNTRPLVAPVIAACQMVAHENSKPEDVLVIESMNKRFIHKLNVAFTSSTWWVARDMDEDAAAPVGGSPSFGRIKRVF